MKKKVGKIVRRRRLEAKTNYSKRIKLLKGNSPRIVFRKSNKYIIAQLIISKEAQDKIKFGITSKKLLDYGFFFNEFLLCYVLLGGFNKKL